MLLTPNKRICLQVCSWRDSQSCLASSFPSALAPTSGLFRGERGRRTFYCSVYCIWHSWRRRRGSFFLLFGWKGAWTRWINRRKSLDPSSGTTHAALTHIGYFRLTNDELALISPIVTRWYPFHKFPTYSTGSLKKSAQIYTGDTCLVRFGRKFGSIKKKGAVHVQGSRKVEWSCWPTKHDGSWELIVPTTQKRTDERSHSCKVAHVPY